MHRICASWMSILVVAPLSAARVYAMPPASSYTLTRPSVLHVRPPYAHRATRACQVHDAALCLHPPLVTRPVPTVAVEPPSAHTPARASSGRLPEPPKPVENALARDVALGHGRALSVQLTPTPSRCAPLVKLTF